MNERKTVTKILSAQTGLVFTPRKAVCGFLLGITALFLFSYYYRAFFQGIQFALSFFLMGLFRFDQSAISSPGKKRILFSVLPLIIALALMVVLCTQCLNILIANASSSLLTGRLLLNYLCAFVLFAFFMVCTDRIPLSLFLTCSVIFLLSLVNAYVFQFKEKEIIFGDIFAAGTALNVLGTYNLHLPYAPFATMLRILSFSFALLVFPKPQPAKPLRNRLVWLAALLASFILCTCFLRKIKLETYRELGSCNNGFFLNFCVSIRYVREPSIPQYSPQIVEELSQQFSSEENSAGAESYPNIIVIMNESFADLDIFPTKIKTSAPVLPFTSSLSENTVKGHALVSIFGAGTPNSEFELLSGHSMAFFPVPYGTIPYQQFIKGPIYSLPYLMRSLGYETIATHPMGSTNWSRDSVYPFLGFESCTFIEDYPKQDLICSYVSDREVYQYILNKLSSPDRRSPLFLFGVTMQNHGGYLVPDYENSITLEGYDASFPMAEQWLSLMHESDKALEYLIRELEQFPEDTIVLFYGDHLPKIENELYVMLNGGAAQSLDEEQLKYTVPFFIWANYDIKEYALEITSLNYLAGHVLDSAGIQLPPYYQFLRSTEKKIPAINAFGYYSISQACMIPLAEAVGEEAAALQCYEYAQYNNLFDTKNRNYLFYDQFLSN